MVGVTRLARGVSHHLVFVSLSLTRTSRLFKGGYFLRPPHQLIHVVVFFLLPPPPPTTTADALRRSSASSASSSSTLPCLIKASAQLEAAPEGKQLHGLALKLGCASDPFVSSSLVSFYAKCGDLGSASKVFDRIACKDSVAWNSLIDGYAKSGAIGPARKLFDEMPQRDLFSWTSLINGYSKLGEIDTARELFDRMPEKNAVSWNAMINGYMRSGDFASARRLFDEMPMRNLVTWNSMISGFEKLGLFNKALEVYDAMRRENLAPNTVTLVSALSAVSGLALLQRGKVIHTHVRQNGFNLDGVLGVCLIEMYSKCGSIKSALSVFKRIHRKKVGHWTAMITGLGMHGMAGHAIKLFGEMQGAGFKPNSVTFVGVLNGCSHAGMVEEGRRYFELMRTKYDIRATVEHYGCLVDLLCRVGRLEEARVVINRMPMKPNKVIWMSLLSGCRKYGNIGLGKYAAENVVELAPDVSGCYVLLSNIYASAGRWDEVSKLRELMKDRGVRKDPGCSMVEYDGIVHEFIVGDRSHPQTKEIYCKLNEMGIKLKSAGYVPDTSQVLLCVEDKDKEAELARHSERLAIAFGLINVKAGAPIRVVKNLRVCNDCHSATKLLSAIYEREIVVRDNSRFHHFKDGACSCMDYW
ncbi:pentatricopeptide repeat-containing protein At1g08070, chloroplastic-like [Ananas comosus]|uniref:Pentatricopeptide repeat-containing protein At1g08070, chloroplastic-like n=1 Tax=Ananas comosus TaxID=4615 RepID=A0A6P5G845_ANACO|nr:pentatricopeptide repeat-containing protein At1g08070, chloroplastic-like [Ananas comosus]